MHNSPRCARRAYLLRGGNHNAHAPSETAHRPTCLFRKRRSPGSRRGPRHRAISANGIDGLKTWRSDVSSRFAISGIAIGFAAAALLAACGGAGGTASGPGSLPAPGPGQAQKVLTVTLAIPGNTPQTAARKPQYVSPNTQSITIAVASVNG